MLEKIKQKDKGLYYLILFFTIPLSIILLPYLMTLSSGWMYYWIGVLVNLILTNCFVSFTFLQGEFDKFVIKVSGISTLFSFGSYVILFIFVILLFIGFIQTEL